MTKNILLAATALTALAFAGAATATEITAAKVSNIALTTGVTPISYRLATETVAGTANANIKTSAVAGDNTVTSGLGGLLRFDPGAVGTNYTATYTLTGATFSTAITNAQVAVTNIGLLCTVSTPNIVSGGGAGQNFVTVVFNVASNCTVGGAPTAPNGVTFDIPFTMDSATTATVSASIGYTVASTSSAYGGANGTVTLVSRAPAYTTGVSANTLAGTTLPTQVALGTTPPAYVALVANGATNDNIIGSIKATTAAAGAAVTANATGVYASLATPATAIPALTYTASLVGNYAVVKPNGATSDANALVGTVATPNFASATPFTSATLASSSGDLAIFATIAGGNTTSVTSPVTSVASVTYVSATPTLTGAPQPITNANLETVGQQGTNFVAPWMPLANANNAATLRLSNGGTIATGPISIVLSAPNSTVAATTNTCTIGQAQLSADSSTLVNGGIPANGAIFILGTTLATCFGTTAQNGDVRVIVQGLKNELTAKVRVRNTVSGATYESSLGRLGDIGGVAF